VKTAGGVVF